MPDELTDEHILERTVAIYRKVSPGGRPPASDGSGELDSMAFLEFITLLEREFKIRVKVRDLNDTNFKTTQRTVAYVRSKVNPPKPGS